jgi:NADH dehydrogenase
VFFSALNAHHHSRTRFFRAKALAEDAVESSSLRSTVFRPSIIYTPGDPWLTLLDRLSRLPAVPVSGSGKALYQPVWAEDVAEAVVSSLDSSGSTYELAGPEVMSYNDIVRAVLRAAHRRRRLLHVPLPLVRASFDGGADGHRTRNGGHRAAGR